MVHGFCYFQYRLEFKCINTRRISNFDTQQQHLTDLCIRREVQPEVRDTRTRPIESELCQWHPGVSGVTQDFHLNISALPITIKVVILRICFKCDTEN